MSGEKLMGKDGQEIVDYAGREIYESENWRNRKMGPEDFGGTDEESHLMSQTAASKLRIDDPFEVHPTPASGMPAAEYHAHLTEPAPAPHSLSFAELREKNQERLREAFPEHIGCSPALWALCAAGEMGEACSAIKKHYLRHEENPTKLDIGYEIADVVIYLDLLAKSMGFHLEDLVAEKFNIVSERKGCEVFL